MTLRITIGGVPASPRMAAVAVHTAHTAKVSADRKFRHAPGSMPTAGRALVTRTDIGSRNYRLTKPGAKAGGYVNPRQSDVASVRFGDGDKRGIVTATRRDSFGDEAGTPPPASTHFHRHGGEVIDCPVSA